VQATKARGKLTRREIKQDKLLIWFSRVSMVVQDNMWYIAGVIVGVVLLGTGYYIYRSWDARQTERGMAQVSGLEMLVRQEQYDRAITQADQIIGSYVGLPDRMARLYKADALRGKGDYAGARAIYEKSKWDDEITSFHATKGLADCLGAEKQYERAGKLLIEWVDDNKGSGFAPMALMEASTNLELALKYSEAQAALQRILDDYSESQLVGRARQRIRMLEGAVQVTGS